MRQVLKSSAGFVVLIVVGLIVAAAGTATAARLITSADIKNGTITSKDIKNGTIKSKDIKPGTISEKRLSDKVKSKLNSSGAQGPKGDPGAPAPGGFVIKDGDGNPVSGFVAVDQDSFLREVDGGLWQYRWDGGFSDRTIYFTDNDCGGTPLVLWGWSSFPPNPQLRVYGENSQGYRFGGNRPASSDSQSLFSKNSGCVNSYDTESKWELVPVNAPLALNGPLTVQANP
ncbi:MAG: hypothetical protein R2720_09625 [Candidatus Nanopelagicales bacterium]